MKQRILDISITLGACMTICTTILFFTKGNIDNYINSRIKEYADSSDHKVREIAFFEDYVKSASFEKTLFNYLKENNSSAVSFRSLLANRLGIDESQVINKIYELFDTSDDIDYRKRLINVLRLLNRLHPEENIWNIN